MLQATEVRKQWSFVCDMVAREKPQFIKRTRDKMWLSNLETVDEILSAYHFTADRFIEDDGSVTLSLHEIDLAENEKDEVSVRTAMGSAILEYAREYYKDYTLYANTPNRKGHVPYVFKALIADDPQKIGESILCRDGKN